MALSIHKKLITLAAAALAVALLFGSTFAWQSISQEALNELRGATNPGGRLHDDFNDISYQEDEEGNVPASKVYDKDVYVENFTSPNDGVQVFARVRLDEYMEIGTGAGTDNADKNVTIVGAEDNPTATLGNRTTWTTYLYGDTTSAFRQYWTLAFGGQTTYMPTFNKNKDSLAADINGTSQTGFADYVDYSDERNAEKHLYAIYDKDDNNVDELSRDGVDLDALIQGTQPLGDAYQDNVRKVLETHTAQKTIDGTVISMKEWLELDATAKIGDFWVYDTDGWAYWASPIDPGTATGLLLTQISRVSGTLIQGSEWYYGINVVAQFITADDLGLESSTGFYDASSWTATAKAPTENALTLLSLIGVDVDGSGVALMAMQPQAEATAGNEEELLAALRSGGDITLTDDIVLTETASVWGDAELRMNGYQLSAAPELAGAPLLRLRGGVWLDISGGGTLLAPEGGYAVSLEEGSRLYLWDGTYVGGAAVLLAQQGEATIVDGVYRGALVDWVESGYADGSAAVTVCDGVFYDTDPSDVRGESLLAEGCTVAVTTVDGQRVYTVLSPGEEPQEALPEEDGGDQPDEPEEPAPSQPEDDEAIEPTPSEPSGEDAAAVTPDASTAEPDGGAGQTGAVSGIFGKAEAPAEAVEPTVADGDGTAA